MKCPLPERAQRNYFLMSFFSFRNPGNVLLSLLVVSVGGLLKPITNSKTVTNKKTQLSLSP